LPGTQTVYFDSAGPVRRKAKGGNEMRRAKKVKDRRPDGRNRPIATLRKVFSNKDLCIARDAACATGKVVSAAG
jgi:hypothetical protein